MNCVSYLETMFDPIARDEALARVNPDTIEGCTLVCTGTSGLLWGMALSVTFGNNICVVRKNNDGSHSGAKVENPPTGPWVFVDDLIDTGATFLRVWGELKPHRLPIKSFKGVLLYEPSEFYSPEWVAKRLGYNTIVGLSRSI